MFKWQMMDKCYKKCLSLQNPQKTPKIYHSICFILCLVKCKVKVGTKNGENIELLVIDEPVEFEE